jgi:hypothetical protein
MNLDIQTLLSSTTQIDYLANRTIDTIADEIYTVLSQLSFTSTELRNQCDKLIGYRFIPPSEITYDQCSLHKGQHVRWIRLTTPTHKLTAGGIVVDIKYLDTGIHVLCMTRSRNFIQYKVDECLTFQKLSADEQLILMAQSDS